MRGLPRHTLLGLAVCCLSAASTSLLAAATALPAAAALPKPVIHRFVATKQSDTLVEFQSQVTGARFCVLSSDGISGPGIHAVLCSSLKVTFVTLPPNYGTQTTDTYTLYALREHGGRPAAKSVKVASPTLTTFSRYLTNVQAGANGSAQFVVPAGESLAVWSVALQSTGQGSASNVAFSVQPPGSTKSSTIIEFADPGSAPHVYDFKSPIVLAAGSVLMTSSGCDQGSCTVTTTLGTKLN